MSNMFERAVRVKLRFAHKGMCSVEDLWDCSVEDLDMLYRGLREEHKKLDVDSLLKKTGTEEGELKLKVDIVKHIVETKLTEADVREKAMETRMRNDKIKGILARKQDVELENKSVEELEAMLEE